MSEGLENHYGSTQSFLLNLKYNLLEEKYSWNKKLRNLKKDPWLRRLQSLGVNLMILICSMYIAWNYILNLYLSLHRLIQLSESIIGADFAMDICS